MADSRRLHDFALLGLRPPTPLLADHFITINGRPDVQIRSAMPRGRLHPVFRTRAPSIFSRGEGRDLVLCLASFLSSRTS
jgi:hypothetical protein